MEGYGGWRLTVSDVIFGELGESYLGELVVIGNSLFWTVNR